MLTEAGIEEWPFIAATIEPAISEPTLAEVHEGLRLHHMQAWRLSGGAAGYLVTKTAYVGDTSTRAMWVLYASGKVFGPKRQTMRRIARELEQRASQFGEDEMRVTDGRVKQWASVLTDYERIDYGLRKVLHG